MLNLTVQIHTDQDWIDAATFSIHRPENGFHSRCSIEYHTDYLVRHLDDSFGYLAGAISVDHPLEWGAVSTDHAPAFVYDISPAGAARRFLCGQMDKPDGIAWDSFLLASSTRAPIGNLRIKESVLPANFCDGLGRQSVINSNSKILSGASASLIGLHGAVGAGGEAPKLLLAEDSIGNLYPDAMLSDGQVRQHYLVKFPRNRGSQTDQDILRSEYHYYRALHSLGIETIDAGALALEEGERPSLWMPRFDREVSAHGTHRKAVESIYSIMGVVTPGSYQEHSAVFDRLASIWVSFGQGDEIHQLAREYIRRDVLNQILGNSDNHGRNTAIIRDGGKVALAPFYDLAPMVMDDEGICRSTKWGRSIECGGVTNWRLACKSLSQWTDADDLFDWLKAEMNELMGLPDILVDSGLPARTMAHPRVLLRDLSSHARRWGLL
ncbi:HipA domain-containing protein [Pseudomonas syringae pv. actinidiae]|nr:HipA domain-containing protein [Pseudomonas syringae pv. actinidiae]